MIGWHIAGTKSVAHRDFEEAQLRELESQAIAESLQTGPNDIMAHVLRPDVHGRVQGKGFEATPLNVFGAARPSF